MVPSRRVSVTSRLITILCFHTANTTPLRQRWSLTFQSVLMFGWNGMLAKHRSIRKNPLPPWYRVSNFEAMRELEGVPVSLTGFLQVGQFLPFCGKANGVTIIPATPEHFVSALHWDFQETIGK